MTLAVETGSGAATSESYASVSDADTRLANLGMTTWATLQTSEKESALRRATNFMEQAYRERWKGIRNNISQALAWPRYDVQVDGRWPVPVNTVPNEVRNACVDLALKAAAGDLNGDLATRVVREKIGPVETEYDRFSPQTARYPAIEMQLSPFLKGSGMCATLVRA